MSVSLYDSRSLTESINKVKYVNPFVLDKVFSYKRTWATDKIDVEIVTGSSKMAQFVGANEPKPKNIAKLTRETKTVTLPRTFESKLFTANELMAFNAVGALYDQSQKLAFQKEMIALNLQELKERVLRRREQMAVEALCTGKISVTQSNTAWEIDYGYVDTEQLVTLSGTDLFTNSASKPVTKLRQYQKLIQRRSGVAPSIALLGSSAAEAFTGNAEVQKALNTLNYKVGQMDLTVPPVDGAFYIGRIGGVEFWEYTQQYVDDSGNAVDMLTADRMVLVAPSSSFRLHIGPAYRIVNQLPVAIQSELFLEVDDESDSRGLQWNCEQKSLPTIHDPGAVMSIKVV